VILFVLILEFLGWPHEEEDVCSQNGDATCDSSVAVPLPVPVSCGSESTVPSHAQSTPETVHVRSIQSLSVFIRFDILTAVMLRIQVFWDVMLFCCCCVSGFLCLKEFYCAGLLGLHHISR
jgi:hypothetical protein